MGLITYLIRMLPFTLMRKKLSHPFFQSLMYYLPYTILATMTFPAIFYSAGNIYASIAGTFVALILAFRGHQLITVALFAAASAFVTGCIIP